MDSEIDYASYLNLDLSNGGIKVKRYELTADKKNFDKIALCITDLIIHLMSNGINFKNFHIHSLDFNKDVYSLVDIFINLVVDACPLSYWSLVLECLLFDKIRSYSSIKEISELLFTSKLLTCLKNSPINFGHFLDLVDNFCSYESRALIKDRLHEANLL